VLDHVEDVLVGMIGGDCEVAGTDQEQRRAPGAAAVDAVTAGAVRDIEPLAA